METFQEFIPLELLPEEYGGSVGTLAEIRELHARQIEDSRDWLMQNPWLSDERKRPGSSRKSITDSATINGSFRSICLD